VIGAERAIVATAKRRRVRASIFEIVKTEKVKMTWGKVGSVNQYARK
jgi:hypothetical protein